MKNIATADRPKSATAMLPPRPLRGSEKVAQTACNSDRREGKSCIPTLNQTFADSRILKISKSRTFRIAVYIYDKGHYHICELTQARSVNFLQTVSSGRALLTASPQCPC